MHAATRLILGLTVPVLAVMTVILLFPTEGTTWLGISLRSWCLFACAPLTSLLLMLCLDRRG